MIDSEIGRRWVLPVVVTALLALIATPAAFGFYPYFHLSNTLGALEGAGFSYEQAWMLAFFNIEIDIATEPPGFVCRDILRWPTQSYVCPKVGRVYGPGYAPCATGVFFDDWSNHCLPFHSPGSKAAYALPEVQQLWNLESMTGALHLLPGERCYDWLKRFGHMLHGLQDYYAHSNWVEVFHLDLGFDFADIPSWTTFRQAQRGATRNLILLQHAGGDETRARDLHVILSNNLKVEKHDIYNKDSNQLDDNCYDKGSRKFHEDRHGHDVLDFHHAANRLAGVETYQIGLQMRLNVVNNPDQGPAVWATLFNCVTEMANYDGVSIEEELETYKKGVGRLKTYGGIWGKWR